MGVYHLSSKFVTNISIYDGLCEEIIKSSHNEKLVIHHLRWVNVIKMYVLSMKGHITYIIYYNTVELGYFYLFNCSYV